MIATAQENRYAPRVRFAFACTLFTGMVALIAALNLYLLEDGNVFTSTAYALSPLLRFSYDGVYVSALVVGTALCALFAEMLVRNSRTVTVGLCGGAVLVMLAGFGGLLVRQPLSFVVLAVVFVLLLLLTRIQPYPVARARAWLDTRDAALLRRCIGVGIALVVNLVALVLHTLALNPASHQLYMQGQIAGTHLNSVLLTMVLAVVCTFVCFASIVLALRPPRRD